MKSTGKAKSRELNIFTWNEHRHLKKPLRLTSGFFRVTMQISRKVAMVMGRGLIFATFLIICPSAQVARETVISTSLQI
jgi:hypothetical protein